MDLADEECDYMVKIILIGDSSVGKTCIIHRFNDPNTSTELKSNTTIGYEFWNKYFEQDDRLIQVHLWDTAGQEKHRSMVATYYRKTAGWVLVYDITDYTSFENCKRWIKELRDHNEDNCKLIIVGNKWDLTENRAVTTEEGEKFALENDAAFFETSAKTGLNIQRMFETLITKIVECLKQMESAGTHSNPKGSSIMRNSVKLDSESEHKEKKCKMCRS